MDWGYKGQTVTSCDTRNVCAQDYELAKNPKGALWFAKPISDFTAGIKMSPGQAIAFLDAYSTTNYQLNGWWQLPEKEYVGPAQISFSYDTSMLTEIKPIENADLPWYQDNKGSYFKANKLGETIFMITASRYYYDTGYANGTYRGNKVLETHSQQVKVQVVEPSLLESNSGFPIEEQVPIH